MDANAPPPANPSAPLQPSNPGPAELRARLTRLARLALRVPEAALSLAPRGEAGAGLPDGPAGDFLHDVFCPMVTASPSPVVVDDASSDPGMAGTAHGGGALLGVPVRSVTGAVLGALCVRSPDPRAWSGDDVEVLQGLAVGAAAVLELRRELGERRRAEEARHDSEERFNAFMDHSPVLAMMKDARGRYVYVNTEFERRFETSREQAVGGSDDDYLPEDVAARVSEADRAVLATGRNQEYTVQVPMRTGEPRVWQVFKFPFHTSSGSAFVGGVALDVTEREQAVHALRESERRLSEAQRLAHIGSWQLDLASNVGQWSDEHYRLFGLEPGSAPVSYELVMQGVHPDDRERHQRAVEAALRGDGPLDIEHRVVHPDGTVRHLHSHGELERDARGAPARLYGTAQDVTDRVAAQAALRASEERYRRIVEAAGDIIYEADLQGRFTYANPAALRILGYRTEDVLGRLYTDLIRPDYHAIAARHYARQLEERIPTTYFEFPAVARDGSETWIGQVVQLVFADDQVTGIHAVARDISARHEVERLKNEFISIVSHELRTPLTSIRGSLGLLAGGKLGVLPERALRLVEIAAQNTERLVRLINDILDIERIESGAIALERRPVASGDLVRGAVEGVRGMAERAGVALEWQADAFTLQADPDRIVQVLTNLVANAVKFSPADAGAVVRVTAAQNGADAVFAVIDQGRGIPPDKLESVFERFLQVDSSDARQKGGTGLGLAISKTIVEQHGGSIRVESEPGRGSTFTFVLPAAAGATHPQPPPSRLTVLVCDDEEAVRRMLCTVLERHGYHPVPCASGEEALRLAGEQPPAAILLDLVMPGMSGLETLAELRREPRTRGVPVVVLSAAAPEGGVLHASGAMEWLGKPVAIPALVAAVRRAVDHTPRLPRVLVVEDDRDLAHMLAETLADVAEAYCAASGGEAIDKARGLLPDVLVLDVELAEVDGYEVVRTLRAHDHLRGAGLVVYAARDLGPDERDRLRLGETRFLTKGRASPQEVADAVAALLERARSIG